ncbi:4147_t:CDS:2 [Funneliformis caledonium]|uniref:4147_t:CDS:1 n=1 Tax=Funneliformis caledonium TaxID=1117310 RepID=A0A9N9CGP1_9GLOM|nr:4147_t:CDS:2 [Funneliformis caledonium]
MMNIKWGAPALVEMPSRKKKIVVPPVELFKLHMSDLPNNLKPKLPVGYKKAITDYLREIGKVMMETVVMKLPKVNFFEHVLLVSTFPAEYSESARSIMRESEAAAIYCMEQLQYHDLEAGTNFMVVDCGGDRVVLTTRKLVNRNQLGKSLKYLRISVELDLDYTIPKIKQYITDEDREILEEIYWEIELGFYDINSMFDPVVEKILRLIHAQLDSSLETCSAMFLVGGFSESKYLQNRIKREFQHIVRIILIPSDPTIAIEHGAVMYGLSSMNSDITTRGLKY